MPTAARTTGAGVSPHVRGRGFSPNEAETFPPTRPWHVRFRGNLCASLPKVACNSVDRTFLITQKRWNCNDTISIHKRLTGKLHATLFENHDDAPYTIRPRPGQVEKHANAKPPPGSTGTTPAAPLSLGGITPQQAENQHTTTRKEAASTSLHKTRDLTHPLRGIAPVTRRCTRYAALHPNRRGAMPTDRVQCLQIGCTTPSVTSSHADLPERTSTDPTGLAGPGGTVQTAGWARRRSPNSWLGPAAAGPDRPSRRRAERAARGADNERATERAAHVARAAYSPGASLARHKARARGAHTTRPGPAAPNSAEDPGLVKQSDQTVHHEGGECFERGLDLALGQRCERCDSVVGPGAREFARLIEHVVGAQAFHDRGEGLVGG